MFPKSGILLLKDWGFSVDIGLRRLLGPFVFVGFGYGKHFSPHPDVLPFTVISFGRMTSTARFS